MEFANYDLDDYVQPSDESIIKGHLRFELGWTEVRSGLGLIVRGYLLLIGAAVLFATGTGIILSLSLQQRAKIPWQVREIGLFLGLGLLGLASLYCYGCVIVGHWRCLMNVPERRGARWLMFGCLTCILAGPALNLASNLTGIEKGVKLERGLDGVKEFRMSKEGAIMQAGSAGVQALGLILFILFLRAVARCFEDRGRVFLVDVFMIFSAVVIVGTVYLVLQANDFETLMKHLLILGLAWLTNFLGYLIVIGVVRGSIKRGLARLATAPRESVSGSVLTTRAALPLN
jgi:hypothetical protein